MLFSTKTTFTAISSSEFEAHVTSLSSVKPQDFDSNTHQPALAKDEGSRPITSRSVVFITTASLLAILNLERGASIAEVASCAFPIIDSLDTTSFDIAADWLQASFTSRDGGAYILGHI